MLNNKIWLCLAENICLLFSFG